jgi:hypothetical protein
MNSVVSEKKFIQERLGIPYENLSQSYLRAETQLSNLSNYSFRLQAGSVANPLVTEKLLQLNDQFVITHFRVSLRYIDPSTTGVPTATEQLTAQQYLYADPKVFAQSTSGNAINAAAIYNGNIAFIIDRKQFLPAFPMNAFYRVPTTQTGAFLATAGTTGTPAATYTGNTGTNGYDNGLFGFYVSEPTLIDGRQTLDLSLNLNAGVSIATIGTDPMVYATFETRGYLVVNAKS